MLEFFEYFVELVILGEEDLFVDDGLGVGVVSYEVEVAKVVFGEGGDFGVVGGGVGLAEGMVLPHRLKLKFYIKLIKQIINILNAINKQELNVKKINTILGEGAHPPRSLQG